MKNARFNRVDDRVSSVTKMKLNTRSTCTGTMTSRLKILQGINTWTWNAVHWWKPRTWCEHAHVGVQYRHVNLIQYIGETLRMYAFDEQSLLSSLGVRMDDFSFGSTRHSVVSYLKCTFDTSTEVGYGYQSQHMDTLRRKCSRFACFSPPEGGPPNRFSSAKY